MQNSSAPAGLAKYARAIPPLARWVPADRVMVADEARLDLVAEAFARVIDAKSPFTARHSVEVVRWERSQQCLARSQSQRFGGSIGNGENSAAVPVYLVIHGIHSLCVTHILRVSYFYRNKPILL